MRIILFFLLISFASTVHAEKQALPFSSLAKIEIKERLYPIVVIKYDPSVTKVMDENYNERIYDLYGATPKKSIITKISAEDSTSYTVSYFPGPSVDPEFVIFIDDGKELQEVGSVFATEIVIPANGYLYFSGHTNNMYNQKRKYIIKNNTLVEVPQPFYYVGVSSVATSYFKIYTDTSYTDVVAEIASGTPVTVLLNKNEHYLIKTDYGLVGWVKFLEKEKTVIKDIFFAGD